jgi:predicted 3-demethylubiquinone-9 3-methyltransferase (glyoxalase superfamily)
MQYKKQKDYTAQKLYSFFYDAKTESEKQFYKQQIRQHFKRKRMYIGARRDRYGVSYATPTGS